jgi:SAM-dependent methyltransferase
LKSVKGDNLIRDGSNVNRELEIDRLALKYLEKCDRILDLACGLGRFIKYDKNRIEGIEINEKSVKACKENGMNVRIGNVTKLPFKDNAFDGIHCSHIIEHLNPNRAYKMLSEINRVLKPDGILVIRSPLMDTNFYNTFDHVRPYPPETLIRMLKEDDTEQFTYSKLGDYRKIGLHYRWRRCSLKFWTWTCIPVPIRRNGYLLVLRKTK